jgi:DNA-binding MarR family transcriptional regulator
MRIDAVDSKPTNDAGAFAFDALDRTLHEKARLGILTALLPHKTGLAFNELKELCDLTDGNLARHLERLEDSGMVTVVKTKGDGRPKTTVRMTPTGRTKFLDYLGELEAIVAGAIAVGKLAPAAV